MLLRHLADCHYRERLCEGLPPGGDSFKCPWPSCNHESKDKGGFVRHYGLVHKMVQKWLKESGLMDDLGDDDGKKTPTSSVDDDSYQLPPVPPGGAGTTGGGSGTATGASSAAGDFYQQPRIKDSHGNTDFS